jgi:hypothetical protein
MLSAANPAWYQRPLAAGSAPRNCGAGPA